MQKCLYSYLRVFWVAILMILSSCEDCTFTSKNSYYVSMKFYFQSKRNNRNGKIMQITVDSIRTSDNQKVSNLGLQPTANSFTTLIALNRADDYSKFIVFWKDTVRNSLGDVDNTGGVIRLVRIIDTVAFSYNRQLALVSPNCGYDMKIENLAVKQATFDSLFLFKPELQIGDTTNVRIFVKIP